MTSDNTTTGLSQPVKIDTRLATTVARMLARSYPGTTAAEVTGQLAKPAADRDIIGMFAVGSLEDALTTGAVTLADGTLTART